MELRQIAALTMALGLSAAARGQERPTPGQVANPHVKGTPVPQQASAPPPARSNAAPAGGDGTVHGIYALHLGGSGATQTGGPLFAPLTGRLAIDALIPLTQTIGLVPGLSVNFDAGGLQGRSGGFLAEGGYLDLRFLLAAPRALVLPYLAVGAGAQLIGTLEEPSVGPRAGAGVLFMVSPNVGVGLQLMGDYLYAWHTGQQLFMTDLTAGPQIRI